MKSPRLALLNAAVPVTKWLGEQHLPYTHKLTTGEDYAQIFKLCEPGDILLSRIRGELTNLFIQGYYTHAAVVGTERRVVEAIGKGVVQTHLAEWVLRKDYVALLRPKWMDWPKRRQVAEICEHKIGSPYDWTFEWVEPQPIYDQVEPTTVAGFSDNSAFYCAELPAWAMRRVQPHCPFMLKQVAGVLTVLPQDYFDATGLFSHLYVSAPASARDRAA